MVYIKLQVEGSSDNLIECTSEDQKSAFLIYYTFMKYQESKNLRMTIFTDVIELPSSRLNFEKGMHCYAVGRDEARVVEFYEEPISKIILTCVNCIHEKMSSPLYIHCTGCNRNKGLHDRFHDKDEPTKG